MFCFLFSQDLEEDIFADLLDELTLGFCFEIHRSCKMGQLFLDETDEPSLKVFTCNFMVLSYEAIFTSNSQGNQLNCLQMRIQE